MMKNQIDKEDTSKRSKKQENKKWKIPLKTKTGKRNGLSVDTVVKT